jgi:hypothetical protein
MTTPSTPRLLFFTAAILAGAIAALTERFFVVGILLIGFGGIVLMTKRDQQRHWHTPLTKWQIVRGFIPLIVLVALVACMMAAGERGSIPSATTMTSTSGIFKVAFVIACIILIGQPWIRWYRNRNTAGVPSRPD